MGSRPNEPRRWVRFLVGGAVNTGVTYGLYFLLQKGLHYQLAYGIAYGFGVVFSYWFNAVVVFDAPLSWKGLFTYPVVYIVQYLVSALFLSLIVEVLAVPSQIGPLLVVILMIPLTYVMSRWVLRANA